jgi:hypothetical protein
VRRVGGSGSTASADSITDLPPNPRAGRALALPTPWPGPATTTVGDAPRSRIALTLPRLLPSAVPAPLTRDQLRHAMRDITTQTPPTPQNCVELVENLIDRLFPAGIHSGHTRDDSTTHQTPSYASGPGWWRLTDWTDLEGRLATQPPGTTARIVLRWPYPINPLNPYGAHAFLLYHTADAGLFYADLSTNQILPADQPHPTHRHHLPAPLHTLAHVIDATGHTIDPPPPLDAWLAIPNWTTSHTFIDTHQTWLVTSTTLNQAQSNLDRDPTNTHLATHVALLGLAQTNQHQLGYDYLTALDPPTRRTILTNALAHTNPNQIRHLTHLSTAHATTPPDQTDAAILRAVNHALTGNTTTALTQLAHTRNQPHLDFTAPTRLAWITTVMRLAKRLDTTALRRVAEDLAGC